MNFVEFVQWLDRIGVADVLLPFVLIFTIVFAIMQKTEILGKGKKNINIMIALVMGFAVVFPHVLGIYPNKSDPVLLLNRALPDVSIIIVAIVMLLLLIGLLGGEVKWLGTSMSGFIAIVCLIIIIYIFGRAAGWWAHGTSWPSWLWWLDNPDTQAIIIILLIFGIIVWFITRDDAQQKKGNFLSRGLENLGQVFKKN